jgi:hypothetical protein
VKTAQQAQANWTGSSGRAATDWAAGIQAYSGDWAAATVRQQAVMQANWNASLATWASKVTNVGTSGWKQATERKAPNYAQGFNAGAANYAIASGKIMNALANIVPSLPARGTYEQNKQRSTALMDALHGLRGQLGAK